MLEFRILEMEQQPWPQYRSSARWIEAVGVSLLSMLPVEGRQVEALALVLRAPQRVLDGLLRGGGEELPPLGPGELPREALLLRPPGAVPEGRGLWAK